MRREEEAKPPTPETTEKGPADLTENEREQRTEIDGVILGRHQDQIRVDQDSKTEMRQPTKELLIEKAERIFEEEAIGDCWWRTEAKEKDRTEKRDRGEDKGNRKATNRIPLIRELLQTIGRMEE